jgi:methylase of polypeptide subunit release factors
MHPASTPLNLDREFAQRVRAVLDAAGFNSLGLIDRLGPAAQHIEPLTVPMLCRRTAQLTPIDVFARVYVLGLAVDAEAVERAISPMTLDEWVEGGLLEHWDDGIGSAFAIFPEGKLLVLADPPASQGRAERRPDRVMGVAQTTRDLMSLGIEAGIESTFELGTGCGVVALLQREHGGSVVASDINERALCVARFNALINGLDVDIRGGSMFEPVAGLTFDRIISNPPFVISPSSDEFTYRDGGMEGDRFVQTVLETAPAHLKPGGQLRIMAQWAIMEGQSWEDRIHGWIAGSNCDMLILQNLRQAATVYSQGWIDGSEKLSPAAYRKKCEEWFDYFEHAGIEAVATGWIILRKRADDAPGEPFVDVSLDADALDHGAADVVTQLFRNRDFLRTASDEELLSCRPVLAPDALLEQVSVATEGNWQPKEVLLRMSETIKHTVRIDGRVAVVLGAFDGKTTVLEAAARLAAQMGVDARSLAGALKAPITRMFEHGFLTLPD